MAAALAAATGAGAPMPDGVALVGMTAACLCGSLAPDVDIPTSAAGHLLKPVSVAINTVGGHRGLFHAPLPYLLSLAAVFWLARSWLPIAVAFGLGVLSHLCLDALNAQGVPLLWPLKYRFSIGAVKVGGLGEGICRLALVVALGGLSVILGKIVWKGGIL